MMDETATILDLPIELRDNIVACLDIKDVLSLSLACKYFRTIMESRQTWMSFVQKTQQQPNISKIEEPLEDFTTQELRDWVLRRHKIRQSLHSGSRATCHYIQGADSVRETVLLPGGRWLLLENSPGKISYADCDAPCPQTQPLITFEDVVPGHTKVQFVVWRDPDSRRLTFRVAILYWYKRNDGDSGYQAHFYKIDLFGHGSSAKLVAERLHRYQGSISNRETSGEAIRGECFYQFHHLETYDLCVRSANRRASLEILDYGSSSSVAKQVTLVDLYFCLRSLRFDILPDGRIVVSGDTEIVIYPDPLSIVGNETKTLAPSLFIDNTNYAMRVRASMGMSEWYSGLDSNMAVYDVPSKRMIAVWIPHDGAPPMRRTIEQHIPIAIDGYIKFGLFHGVTKVSRGRIDIFNYPWGDFQNETHSGGMIRRAFYIERDQYNDIGDIDEGYFDIGILYFNEELGRTIIQDYDHGYFVIDIVVT